MKLITDPSLNRIDRNVGVFIIACVLIGSVLGVFFPMTDDSQYLRTRTQKTRTMRTVRGGLTARRKAA